MSDQLQMLALRLPTHLIEQIDKFVAEQAPNRYMNANPKHPYSRTRSEVIRHILTEAVPKLPKKQD